MITRPRTVAMTITVVLGALGAFGGVARQPTDYVDVARSAQMFISVSLPFLGAGLGFAALHPRPRAPATSSGRAVLVAVVLALSAAVFGAIVAAVATGVSGVPWGSGGTPIVLTSLAVQVLAQLTGTGFGFLLPRAWLAGLATIVIPLGTYWLLGLVRLTWVTPFGGFQAVFSSTASAADWGRWLVMFMIWGVGLNLLGLWSRRRWRRTR